MESIGKLIINTAKIKGISLQQLGQNANISRTATYKMLKRNDLYVSRLYSISQALHHDFFLHYSQQLGIHSPSANTLTDEIKTLRQQIHTLQRESNLLHDFIQTLKSKMD
jgi:predicted DNA-binding protein YlxM (UPF0122 family)